MGLLHPRIYLTWKIIASGPKALRAILYHELAHILRRDGWITILQAAALVIHPFNPLVWIMNARLSRYREQLCDDFALKHTGVAPRDYGNLLLDQLSQGKLPLLAIHTPTYFFETRRDLVHRLHQLLKQKGRDMNLITSPQKMLLAGLAFGLLAIASQCAEETVSLTPQAAVEESTEGWLARGGWLARWTFPVPESTHVKVVLYDANAGKEVAVLFDGIPGKEYIRTELLPENAEGLLIPAGGYRQYFITSEGREAKGIIPAYGPSKIRTYPVDSNDEKFEAFATNAKPPALAQIEGTEQAAPGYPVRVIDYSLAESGNVSVVAYDQAGEEVVVLFNGPREAGPLKIIWGGRKADGEPVPLGVYFIRIETSGDSKTYRATFRHIESSDTLSATVRPPPPADSPNVRFVPYDSPPTPIGGYAAIQENLVYPNEARATGIEGVVIVMAFIDENGQVTETEVRSGAPSTGLNEAAVEAIKNTTFEPAKEEGRPVGVWIGIPVSFSLDEDVTAEPKSSLEAPVREIPDDIAAEFRAVFDKVRELKPPPPEEGPTVRFIRYDEKPKPIGGFVAIQQHLVYPQEAKDAGIEGTIIVHAFVDENGQVQETKILKGIPNTGFDEAAVAAIKGVSFEPAKDEGKPVGIWISVPVNFKLNDGEK